MDSIKQAVVTVASGSHAERLDYTFTSFARNRFLNLHAFIIGDTMPEQRLPGISYHLKHPDISFLHPLRDMYYRRLLFLADLDEEYALLVDNSDVLCLQSIPELPQLLRGASFGACVEQAGSRYINGQGYTSCYLNAGVTFWHIPSTCEMRREIVKRGQARFRSVEDQLTLNEVIQTRYYDSMIILPSQYNYRPYFEFRKRGWPTVDHLDGVKIFHNAATVAAAKRLEKVKPLAELTPLDPDRTPPNKRQRLWRRMQLRLKPHIIR